MSVRQSVSAKPEIFAAAWMIWVSSRVVSSNGERSIAGTATGSPVRLSTTDARAKTLPPVVLTRTTA